MFRGKRERRGFHSSVTISTREEGSRTGLKSLPFVSTNISDKGWVGEVEKRRRKMRKRETENSWYFLDQNVPRTVPRGRRVPEERGNGVWKQPQPSLADRWKIHKLFQEKRRKSISNYSFLWRVAAGHAAGGPLNGDPRSPLLLHLLLLRFVVVFFFFSFVYSFIHLQCRLSTDSSGSSDAANAAYILFLYPPTTRSPRYSTSFFFVFVPLSDEHRWHERGSIICRPWRIQPRGRLTAGVAGIAWNGFMCEFYCDRSVDSLLFRVSRLLE